MTNRIPNFGWNRLKLATLTYEQLAQLEEQVKAEHACKNGIHLFDKAGQRKLDALSWAVYNKQKAERAAMLQAGTLTNEGTKQAWTGIPDIDNAINMLDRIDTLESCDDDRIEAVKTVLRGLAGNSPVIPDGYVMVPKVPSQTHLNSIAMRYRHDFYLLNDAQKDNALATARQMYEECSGQGFYTLPAAPQEVR